MNQQQPCPYCGGYWELDEDWVNVGIGSVCVRSEYFPCCKLSELSYEMFGEDVDVDTIRKVWQERELGFIRDYPEYYRHEYFNRSGMQGIPF